MDSAAFSRTVRLDPKKERCIELVCDSGIEGRASSKTPLKTLNLEVDVREASVGGLSSEQKTNVPHVLHICHHAYVSRQASLFVKIQYQVVNCAAHLALSPTT